MAPQDSPNSTYVPTITVVNPSAPPAKRELHINATDLELWRAKGYRLHSELGTPEPTRAPENPRPTEPRKPEGPKAT